MRVCVCVYEWVSEHLAETTAAESGKNGAKIQSEPHLMKHFIYKKRISLSLSFYGLLLMRTHTHTHTPDSVFNSCLYNRSFTGDNTIACKQARLVPSCSETLVNAEKLWQPHTAALEQNLTQRWHLLGNWDTNNTTSNCASSAEGRLVFFPHFTQTNNGTMHTVLKTWISCINNTQDGCIGLTHHSKSHPAPVQSQSEEHVSQVSDYKTGLGWPVIERSGPNKTEAECGVICFTAFCNLFIFFFFQASWPLCVAVINTF